MAAVICANVVFIGISMDHGEGGHEFGVWFMADTFFSILYIIEFGMKVTMAGASAYFCGNNCIANRFDFCLILIDLAQTLSYLIAPEAAEDLGAPSASLFRVLRLLKLLRLIRLMRNTA